MGLNKGTRSGKRLLGMLSDDALLDIKGTKDWRTVKPSIACVIAELLDSYVTYIDPVEPDGFYVVNNGYSLYLKFTDYLDIDVWLTKKKNIFVNFSVVFVDKQYKVDCTLMDSSIKTSFSDKSQKVAQCIALLLAMLEAKRKGFQL